MRYINSRLTYLLTYLVCWSVAFVCLSPVYCWQFNSDIQCVAICSGRSQGWAGGPADCGHSKLAYAHTGLPLTSVQFINVTEVVTKSVTIKRNKIFLQRPLKLKFGYAFVFCWSPF